MGNSPSKASSSSKRAPSPETATARAKKMVGDMQSYVTTSVKKLDDDHPATQFFDTLCGNVFEDDKLRSERSTSFGYSEDVSEDEDSRTVSDSDTMDEFDRRRKAGKKHVESESESLMSQSDYESVKSEALKKEKLKAKQAAKRAASKKGKSEDSQSYLESEDERVGKKSKEKEAVVRDITSDVGPGQLSKPMASAFAKRCYFTKAGIGKSTQHYEGLTLTGNIVLMLATAMKLKGCPTICDEDLRRVEQTYPNQFSRLPDELLLSSGWRRISKYCHFSNKPIPDGVPFFHSKVRNHANGGYHFLLAAAVGMIRPIDVEPLTRDTLVLLETDFPTQCDAMPAELVEDPTQWTLVDKFCFFSGGPINTEEDVYYQADFDGNPIYMLAFLSPSLTPDELYRLQGEEGDDIGLKSCREVEEVESVYELTERDFEDLKLYHLGPCRALPPYILQPLAWSKVLPPHFLEARENALHLARQYEMTYGVISPTNTSNAAVMSPEQIAAIGDGPNLQEPVAKSGFNYDPSRMQAEGDEQDPGYFDEWNQGQPSEGPVPFSGVPPKGAPYYPPASQFSPIPHIPVGPPGPTGGYGYYDPASLGGTQNAVHPYPPGPQSYASGPQPYSGGSEAYPAGHQSYTGGSDVYPGGPQSYSVAPPGSYARGAEWYKGGPPSSYAGGPPSSYATGSVAQESFQRQVEEEGAFVDSSAPIDEQIASRTVLHLPKPSPSRIAAIPVSPPGRRNFTSSNPSVVSSKMDPPVDEPPSLSKRDVPDDEAFQQYGPDASPSQSGYSSSGMEPLPTSETGYQHQRHPPNGGYYRKGDYYDSPDKMSPGGQEYYPREEEYYDSPEAIHRGPYPSPPRNGEYADEHFPPDEFSPGEYPQEDFSPGEYPPDGYMEEEYAPGAYSTDRGYPPSPPRGRNYYVSPDKTQTSDPGYSQSEGEYYNSPGYTEESGSALNSVEEGPRRDVVPMAQPMQYPGMSPRSEVSARSMPSDYTPSSAMRSAQDLLKKNREKRLISSARGKKTMPNKVDPEEGMPFSPRTDDESQEESTSEITSVISGSSVWTDGSTGDRSSRRALILQMAKARMKSNKPPGESHVEDKTTSPIEEETSFVSGDDQTWDGGGGRVASEIDFTGELD